MLLRKIRDRLKHHEASSMLECVVVVPLWVLVMFSIIDFSAYANARWDCMAISRATVRAGSLRMINAEHDKPKNDKYMSDVQTQMAKSMISGKFSTISSTKVNSGAQEGDAVYARTCVNVHLIMNQIWGKDKAEVCEDYIMLRTFKGTMT